MWTHWILLFNVLIFYVNSENLADIDLDGEVTGVYDDQSHHRSKRAAPVPSIFAVINSTSAVQGYIADTVVLNIEAFFTDVDDTFSLTVTSPTDAGMALASLSSVFINGTGPNLGPLSLTPLTSTSVSHNQVTTLTFDLGHLNNTGDFVPSNETAPPILVEETQCWNESHVNYTSVPETVCVNETVCSEITVNETICFNDTASNETICNQTAVNETVCVNETSCNETMLNVTNVWNTTFCNTTSYNQTSNETLYMYVSQTDTVNFLVAVKIADHVINTQGALFDVGLALTSGGGGVAAGTAEVEVQVTGDEYPYLVTQFNMEQFLYTEKMSGDNVLCELHVFLAPNSTAHAQDVQLHVMTPYYASYGSLVNVTGEDVNVTSNDPTKGFKVQIAEIDFHDVVHLAFTFVLDPARVLPIGMVDYETVVPVDLTYRGPIRGDRTDTGVLYSGMFVHEFGFNTDVATQLGMKDDSIQDCQITASSSHPNWVTSKGRFQNGPGWRPHVRGTPFCGEEYLQIDIGSQGYITEVQIQSSNDHYNRMPLLFALSYSEDGILWNYVIDPVTRQRKEFVVTLKSGGKTANDAYSIPLDVSERFMARYVRFTSLATDKCLIGLRLELKGTKQIAPPVTCVTPPEPPVPEMSYVTNYDTGTIFACGLSGVNGVVRCSRAADNADYWIALDEDISYVIGVISNTSIVLAATRCNGSYVISLDDGVSWDTVTSEQMAEIQANANYLEATSFPYADTRAVNNGNMHNNWAYDTSAFILTAVHEGLFMRIPGNVWTGICWWGTQDWSAL